MLKFRLFDNGASAEAVHLRNAHLLGSDNTAIRADISFENGAICCTKKEARPASLVLQQDVAECGVLTIRTCLLPDRDEPYLLNVELARHRIMMLYNKFEDWAMFDMAADHAAVRRFEIGRQTFIRAICLEKQDPPQADRMARDALVAAVDASEELALAHAEILLERRKVTHAVPRYPIGCGITIGQNDDRVRSGLLSNFDFVRLPVPWRWLAPEEGTYRWEGLDGWAQWIGRKRMPVVAGPLISFRPQHVPDWLFIWEHDYDTVRDLAYEHIQRLVTRYRNTIAGWNVVSGIHTNDNFSFTVEQLIDLSRMSTMLVKKIQPAARALIEICQPFGEYYGAAPRSIPPLLYADLLVQGAVNFDGFIVKLLMGQAVPGQFTRDLMQISNLLDQFLGLGKPVSVVIAVPSEPVSIEMMHPSDTGPPPDPHGGYWRRDWSNLVQSRWLEAVLHVAMSKPFVESIAWHDLIDHSSIELPRAGLITSDMRAKGGWPS